MNKKNDEIQPRQKTEYEEYKDSVGNVKFATERFIEDLGQFLVSEAERSDGATSIGLMLRKKGVCYSTYVKWMKKYPELKEKNEEAKLCIGWKLKQNALRKKLDPGLSKFVLYKYDPEFMEIQKELNESRVIKTEEDGKAKFIILKDISEIHDTEK